MVLKHLLLAISHHMLPMPLRPRRLIHWTRSFSWESGITLQIFLSFCKRNQNWPPMPTQPLSATELINCRGYRYGVFLQIPLWKKMHFLWSLHYCWLILYYQYVYISSKPRAFLFYQIPENANYFPLVLDSLCSFHFWKFIINGFKPTVEEFDSGMSQT